MSDQGWLPLSEVPVNRAVHINVRTPDGDIQSYRWLPYKKGSQYPYTVLGGRWQVARDVGVAISWRNQDLPKVGEFQLNPAIR